MEGHLEASNTQVCVAGLGYIGLPTACLLATKGFQVHGVEVNPRVVEAINRGEVHFEEPDLDVLVHAAVQSGRLTASLEPIRAEVFIIAVPTPFTGERQPDLSYVEQATRTLAPHVQPGSLVVLESTVPPGTTERVGEWLSQARPDLRIASRDAVEPAGADEPVYVAHCPERVLPGRILKELVDNDRIVGGIDAASGQRAFGFYRKFVAGRILVTDSRTAELCKLAENAFRDVNIAYANELSVICDRLGIDVWRMIELANCHPRVNILQPGPGVGGHCIAVDPWFIVAVAPEEARLVRAAREVNDAKPQHVVRQVAEAAAGVAEPRILCLGLAFKADIDDLRESPAVEIVKDLARAWPGRVAAAEPHVEALPQELAELGVELVDWQTALPEADIVVLLTNHQAFGAIALDQLAGKAVIDTRGQWR
jgi:UDP-N-acetyl-D-mannosaminuronic acid dehydrogenase